MLHYVHQLVANFVCLPFGAGQVVYSGFIFFFFCWPMSVNQNSREFFFGIVILISAALNRKP